MKPPCEIIVKKFLPLIRSIVAVKLKENYNLQVNEIADLIGISNAGVSQYIHGVRGMQNDFLKDFPEIYEFCNKVTIELYENMESGLELTQKLGEICLTLRKNDQFVKMFMDGSESKSCGNCFEIS